MNTTPPGTEPGATFTAPPPPPGRQPWRFQRREHGKLLAGVTTGMADAFHIDVMVVRVIWVVVTIASGGLGVAAYGICWLAFPSDRSRAPISEIRLGRRWSAGYIAGIVLLAIGASVVISQIGRMHYMRHLGAVAWAAILIGGGLAILILRHPDEHDDTDAPQPAPPYTATEPPAPTATEFDDTASGADDTTDTAAAAGYAASLPPVPPTSSAWTQTQPWPMARPPRPRRPRRRPFLTPITISLLLIGAGAAALLDSADVVHLTVAGVLASGLIVVGLALLLSTWFGGAPGLIPIGVILLLATIPAVSIDVPISGGVGGRQYIPANRSEIQRSYTLGIGHLALDLSNAPLTNRVTTISASLGIGNLEVDVPADVRIDVRAHVGAGTTDLFGQFESGWPQDTRSVAGVHQPGVLHLDLRLGAGEISVTRTTGNGTTIDNSPPVTFVPPITVPAPPAAVTIPAPPAAVTIPAPPA